MLFLKWPLNPRFSDIIHLFIPANAYGDDVDGYSVIIDFIDNTIISEDLQLSIPAQM